MKRYKKAAAAVLILALLTALSAGCSGGGKKAADTVAEQSGQKGAEDAGKQEQDAIKTEDGKSGQENGAAQDVVEEPAEDKEPVKEAGRAEDVGEETQTLVTVGGDEVSIRVVPAEADDDVIADENGIPLSEEDLANMNGDDPGAPTPFIEYTDFDELVRDSEVEVEEVTRLPFEAAITTYLLYFDGMVEIQYENEEGGMVTFRKGKGADDNSGVYAEYDEKKTFEVDGRYVTFCRTGEDWVLATWTDGSYAWSIYANPGYDLDTMLDMMVSVKPVGQ